MTGYAHADQNNFWRVHSAQDIYDDNSPLRLLKDGDVVRLMHMTTGAVYVFIHFNLLSYRPLPGGPGMSEEGEENFTPYHSPDHCFEKYWLRQF